MPDAEEMPSTPTRLTQQKAFQPCPVDTGDEYFALGLFEFNITRLLAVVEACPDQYPISPIAVSEIPNYGDERRNPEVVSTADLSRPVLLAEIAPRRYTLIDGHHRIARARIDVVTNVPAYRIPCPAHLPFLTTARGYEAYVEYWNGKLKEDRPRTALRRRGRA